MVTIIIILCVLLFPGEEDIDGKDIVGKWLIVIENQE